ncbi:hypothetical protein, partial [Ideonella sp.]|uniref:hypothetical protein n=1 Tax=Ideonella sp. TaxID=1929293 RepID=UPI002B490FF0
MRKDNVVPLRPVDGRDGVTSVPVARRGVSSGVFRVVVGVIAASLFAAWQLVRLALVTVLVLAEPLVRIVLVPIAFLGFFVTLVFGFLMGAPHFPKWGMLAFSIGA